MSDATRRRFRSALLRLSRPFRPPARRRVGGSGWGPSRAGRWQRGAARIAVLALVASSALTGLLVQPAAAAPSPFSLSVFVPSYVTPGGNYTFTLTVKNLTSSSYTTLQLFTTIPANTTFVSGGVFDGTGVEQTIATIGPNATARASFVVRASPTVAVGTRLTTNDAQIYQFTSAGQLIRDAPAYGGEAITTVEAPATSAVLLRNSSGRAFDVTVDGYGFENFSNEPPRNYLDDLGPRDMFELFGPAACASGTTAATCVLTGPAKKWLDAQLVDMGFGHCDGLATSSLRIFRGLPFRGPGTPGSLQAGATTANQLALAQTMENYIARYMQPQYLDAVYDAQLVLSPVATVDRLVTDFNRPSPVPYTLAIYKPRFEGGHSVTAYGVEQVSATESRILIYDNNFPNLREYVTVNRTTNTWRYLTAATPGYPPDLYEGTATSWTLILNPTNARDLPAGQYFDAPFATTATAAPDGAVTALAEADELTVRYAGEGAALVTNSADQATGEDPDTGTFRDEIPDATLTYARGGLGKKVPPAVTVPIDPSNEDEFYRVTLHGKTVDDPTNGSLSITGPGYTIGVEDLALDPGETFDFSFRPNGTNIAYTASAPSAIAPKMFLSYDPPAEGDAGLVFTVENVIVDNGETIYLDLDPALEQVAFEDTSALGQGIDIDMEMIFPDGSSDHFAQPIDLAVGQTRAFLDFGAWDGLKDPAIYIDDVLQNPGANHRLKLTGSTSTVDPTPEPNAPGGVRTVAATFANVTEVSLSDVYFRVADLGEGNVVLDAVGGPSGTGAEIAVPEEALGDDGVLGPNESFTVTFRVGLGATPASTITIDANGAPFDWQQIDPEPAYDAPDASYVLALAADSAPAFITSAPPATGTVGAPYSYTFTASGSPAPTYTVTTGTLPAGLALDPATGVLSGTPTTAGASTFVVTVDNRAGSVASPALAITIAAAAAAPAPAGKGSGGLATTGVPAAGLLLAGLAVLAGGVGLRLAARRRRRLA